MLGRIVVFVVCYLILGAVVVHFTLMPFAEPHVGGQQIVAMISIWPAALAALGFYEFARFLVWLAR
jgi:hypothetical protein